MLRRSDETAMGVGQRKRSEVNRVLREPIVVAAITIAIGNVIILTSLPWTQSTLFGGTNPARWLVLSLLVPVFMVCLAIFRVVTKTVERVTEENRIGPYVLKEEVGRGGMGSVYRAEHALMKRQCAVKLIHSHRADDVNMQDRFKQEARATAQLTHWNTIEVYDYGTSDDGRFYYVMEYLEGVNLHQFVHRFGPMSPGRTCYVLKQICNALYEAEQHRLVHRDVKPSNIFLTRKGASCDVAKLLDFGLVQPAADLPVQLRSHDRQLNGSPAFMCPEQANGIDPDHRGDLYSLGAVAYFLLSGQPPFPDQNPVMQIVAHATSDVPALSERNVSIERAFETIVMKCLKRDPQERYQSARELLLELDTLNLQDKWSWEDAEAWWHAHPILQEASSGSETLDFQSTTIIDCDLQDDNHRDCQTEAELPTDVTFPASSSSKA